MAWISLNDKHSKVPSENIVTKVCWRYLWTFPWYFFCFFFYNIFYFFYNMMAFIFRMTFRKIVFSYQENIVSNRTFCSRRLMCQPDHDLASLLSSDIFFINASYDWLKNGWKLHLWIHLREIILLYRSVWNFHMLQFSVAKFKWLSCRNMNHSI